MSALKIGVFTIEYSLSNLLLHFLLNLLKYNYFRIQPRLIFIKFTLKKNLIYPLQYSKVPVPSSEKHCIRAMKLLYNSLGLCSNADMNQLQTLSSLSNAGDRRIGVFSPSLFIHLIHLKHFTH